MAVLYVALGGALGSALRYLVGLGVSRVLGHLASPVGTFVVNVLGSLVLGVMLEVFSARSGNPGLRVALTTGMMGGFTTYSTFNYEVYRLLTSGQLALGLTYLAATVLVCLAAAGAGITIARAF